MSSDEDRFIASPFHYHSVSFAKSDVLGENDEKFGRFFMTSGKSEDGQRPLWMKFYAMRDRQDDESEVDQELELTGYKFLAFDPVDGFFWSQTAENAAELSEKITKYNPGMEMEEPDIFRHLADAVGGQKKIRWRFSETAVHTKGSLLPSKVLGFISFRCMIGKIALDYKFDCTRLPSARNSLKLDVCVSHVVQPLFQTACYLLQSREALLRIIAEKDKEIADSKEPETKTLGSTPSTSPFVRKDFESLVEKSIKTAELNDTAWVTRILEVQRERQLALAENAASEGHDIDMEKNSRTPSPKKSALESPKKRKSLSPSSKKDAGTTLTSGQMDGIEEDSMGSAVSQQSEPLVPPAKPHPPKPKKKRGLF